MRKTIQYMLTNFQLPTSLDALLKDERVNIAAVALNIIGPQMAVEIMKAQNLAAKDKAKTDLKERTK